MAVDGRISLAGPPPPSTKPAIAVGTAGFSYPDWNLPVWGGRAPRGPEALARLAGWLDLLEVNVSHYRIPPPAQADRWRAATAHRPAFRFVAKLWRGYTHGPERPGPGDHVAMRAFLDALGADGRLVGVLAQFPPTFRAGERERAYVARLAAHFRGIPVGFEPRHASWDDDGVRAGLASAGVAWVVGDWTPGPGHIEPRPLATAPWGYVRLHGRNPAWHRPGVGRDTRYDYLYGPEELSAWVERLRRLAAVATTVTVVTNNHFGGQALANALELRAALRGGRGPAPAPLRAAFPRLLACTDPDPAGPGVDPSPGGWFNPPGT